MTRRPKYQSHSRACLTTLVRACPSASHQPERVALSSKSSDERGPSASMRLRTLSITGSSSATRDLFSLSVSAKRTEKSG